MADADRDTDEQRERYRELLAELRTIIPGVQVLFAFLLTVPFSARFDALDPLGIRLFALSLVTVGLATVILLTPAAYHRLTSHRDRAARIRLGVRVIVVGMSFLAVSIAAAVFVVGRLVFITDPAATFWQLSPTDMAFAITGIVAGTGVALWYILPVIRRQTP